MPILVSTVRRASPATLTRARVWSVGLPSPCPCTSAPGPGRSPVGVTVSSGIRLGASLPPSLPRTLPAAPKTQTGRVVARPKGACAGTTARVSVSVFLFAIVISNDMYSCIPKLESGLPLLRGKTARVSPAQASRAPRTSQGCLEEATAPASAHSPWRPTPASGPGGRTGRGTRTPGCGEAAGRRALGKEGTRASVAAGGVRTVGAAAPFPLVWRRFRTAQTGSAPQVLVCATASSIREASKPDGRRGQWELRSPPREFRLDTSRSTGGLLVSTRGLRPLPGERLRSDGGGGPGGFGRGRGWTGSGG